MYVATLQMQQNQLLQQKHFNKLNAIAQQLIQVGHTLQTLQQQKKQLNEQTSQTIVNTSSQSQVSSGNVTPSNNQQRKQMNNTQSQRRQTQNPTVNQLILHTGNSADNVNINISSDGNSGQNDRNNKKEKEMNDFIDAKLVKISTMGKENKTMKIINELLSIFDEQ
eukprot:501411_1